jgi:hypothetical protein
MHSLVNVYNFNADVLSYRLILQEVPWSGLERQPEFQGVPGGENLEVV